MNLDAILPAGGMISGEFADVARTNVKALVTVGEMTLLERAVTALRESGCVRRIVVIGDVEVREEAVRVGADTALESGDSGPENIFRGLESLQSYGGTDRILVVTTDLPFLTGEAISRFVAQCPADAELCLPILTQAELDARFPGSPSEFVPLKEGQFTLGSVALLKAETLQRNRAHLESVFSARKSQLGMAKLLGFGFVVKFLLKRLSVRDIEARCEALLKCRGAAVPHSPAELALDIDTLEDFRYALTLEAQK